MNTRHAVVALMLAGVTVAGAQDPQRPGRRGRGGPPPGDSMRGSPRGQAAARQAIERLIRTRIQPTDAQMAKLQALDARYEPQRVRLVREEMQTRQQLRDAMLDSTNVDEARIGQLLDQMITFPGKRAALMEAEQKELAGILSPLQRAKYQAIQEQLRRRIEQGRGGPPPKRPPL
jgi:Spy/CpxP family protein refolding chaperone